MKTIIKLSELPLQDIKKNLSPRIINMQNEPILNEAIKYLQGINMRFNVKTGKVSVNRGVISVINKYKTNPYDANDLDNIIGNEFEPWIGNALSHYSRVGTFDC